LERVHVKNPSLPPYAQFVRQIARDAKLTAFKGQTAVVTGGSRGVGSAVALALANAGAQIGLIGRRLDLLESVAAKARIMGSEVTCYRADLAGSAGQLDVMQQLKRDLPHVDILIQCAGVHFAETIENANLADFDTQYQVNTRAPYVLTQGLLPMLKERRGQVVFINSSSGIAAKPKTAQYDSTKHALKAIADSLRGEVNVHGVRVLSVYLGRTASDMQKKIFEMEERPYRPELLLQPEDVASVILNALSLPRTAEVTDIYIRPMIKS
jgi:NADP-dependent 3-hydroxy acid dehydrogenase YdfG